MAFLLLLPLCVACEGMSGDRTAILRAIVPHEERFEAFDAWARRTVMAEPSAPASSAFRETLFAPLRGDDAVLDAWVTREGTSPRTWRMDEGAEMPELVSVRAPRLGEVHAALLTRTVRDRPIEIVVIERRKDETASTRIVVAVVCAVAAP
jgi:hypothetical protein